MNYSQERSKILGARVKPINSYANCYPDGEVSLHLLSEGPLPLWALLTVEYEQKTSGEIQKNLETPSIQKDWDEPGARCFTSFTQYHVCKKKKKALMCINWIFITILLLSIAIS